MQEDQSLVQPIKPQLKSLSVLLAEAFAIYKQKFWKFIGMMLMPLLGLIFLVILISIWSSINLFFSDPGIIKSIVNIVFGILIFVGIVFLIYVNILYQIGMINLIKSEDRFRVVLKQSQSFFWKFLIVSFATTLFVMLWSFLFIIPGLIFLIYYAFSVFALMFEDFQSISALKRSKELVKGYWWPVFSRIAYIYLIYLMLSLPEIILEQGSLAYSVFNFFSKTLILILVPFWVCYLYSIYKNLREIKPEESKVEKKKGGLVFLIALPLAILIIFSVLLYPAISFVYKTFQSSSSSSSIFTFLENSESRDAKRVADIKMISTALELYYNDHEKYPDTLESLKSEILPDLPKNPLPNDGDCEKDFEYTYSVEDDGRSYELVYCLGGKVASPLDYLSSGYHTATPRGISDEMIR